MKIGSIFSEGYRPRHNAPKSSNMKCLLLRYINSPDFPDQPFLVDFADFKLDNAKDKIPDGLWESTEVIDSFDTRNYGFYFPPTPGVTNEKTMVVRVFTSSSSTGERMVHLNLDIRNNGEVIEYTDERDGSVTMLRVEIGVSWEVSPKLPKSGAKMSGSDIKTVVQEALVRAFNEFAELIRYPWSAPQSGSAAEQSEEVSNSDLGSLTVRLYSEDTN